MVRPLEQAKEWTTPAHRTTPDADVPLTASQAQLLQALAVPRRIGSVPIDAKTLDMGPVVAAAEANHLGVQMMENAKQLGMKDLADALAHARQRDTFLARRRHHVALQAMTRLSRVLLGPPIALGALAAAELVHGRFDTRLHGPVVFFVPTGYLRAAAEAVADLPDVRVVDRIAGVKARSTYLEAVWRRSSPPTHGGWRLLTPDDLLLHACYELAQSRGDARIPWLVDIVMLTTEFVLAWDAIEHRAGLWRIRREVHEGLSAARQVGAIADDDALLRIAPGLLARAMPTFFG